MSSTRFANITYPGYWTPVLTSIDNLLYYLIDDVIFILEPNILSWVGEIVIPGGFKGMGLTSLMHAGEPWLAAVNENEVRFIRAKKTDANSFKRVSITPVAQSPSSLSLAGTQDIAYVYGDI